MVDPQSHHRLSRRRFVATLAPAVVLAPALAPRAWAAAESSPSASSTRSSTPEFSIGLELYSVRTELTRDLFGTLRRVGELGYKIVEFYSPYAEWPMARAKDVRRAMDDLGLKCLSTHNPMKSFVAGDGMNRAIELNQILGTRYVILASTPAKVADAEGWQRFAAQMAGASEAFAPHGLFAGVHNHQTEWSRLPNGQRIMDLIAANTPSTFALQLDVGTCVAAGEDPVAWINANPGRIKSVHLKDWAPGPVAEQKGYRVLFGEGVAPWREILAAAERTGGVEFYLMEQEGSRFSEFETAQRCLETFKKLRAS
jgi:sugar phosphate isomerase/epimerase